MLGQLLGAMAPTPAAAAQIGPATIAADSDTDSSESLDSAALEAMLPFALVTPWTAPPTPQATAGAANAISSMDISALIPGGVTGTDRSALTEALAKGLTETVDADGDAAMFANLNASATSAADVAQNSRAAASSDTAARGLHTPVGSSEWADELGTRLTWMAERGHQTASLRLSPEHLGPLEIRISIRDDQASVWFGAAHADTRAAIEQALPRLRESFAAQGLSLADSGVFREAPRDQPRLPATPGIHADATSGDSAAQSIAISYRRLGLVDAYA
jgi:flagellar hook-length control protein FliK